MLLPHTASTSKVVLKGGWKGFDKKWTNKEKDACGTSGKSFQK